MKRHHGSLGALAALLCGCVLLACTYEVQYRVVEHIAVRGVPEVRPSVKRYRNGKAYAKRLPEAIQARVAHLRKGILEIRYPEFTVAAGTGVGFGNPGLGAAFVNFPIIWHNTGTTPQRIDADEIQFHWSGNEGAPIARGISMFLVEQSVLNEGALASSVELAPGEHVVLGLTLSASDSSQPDRESDPIGSRVTVTLPMQDAAEAPIRTISFRYSSNRSFFR